MKKIIYSFKRSETNNQYYWQAMAAGKTGERQLARSSETYKNLGDCVHSLALILGGEIDIHVDSNIKAESVVEFLGRDGLSIPVLQG